MDNVIGFFSFMVLKLVSLTKLSSNLGASVTEIARNYLQSKVLLRKMTILAY